MPKGEKALARSVSPKFHSLANNLGWDLKSPEMVYISGFYLFSLLRSRLGEINQRREEISGGQITFLTNEQREEEIQKAKEELALLAPLVTKMAEGLEIYAQNFSGDPRYLEILQILPQVPIKTLLNKCVFGQLKNRQIEKAYNCLCSAVGEKP